MSNLINMTPHAVNILREDGDIELTPCGVVPRVETEEVWETNRILFGVPVKKIIYKDVYDLPEPEFGTILIVSQLCCQACPDRDDLVFPADLKRDEAGRIVGCAAFGTV